MLSTAGDWPSKGKLYKLQPKLSKVCASVNVGTIASIASLIITSLSTALRFIED